MPHIVEDPRRRVRVGEGRKAGATEDRVTGGHIGPTHPTSQNRLLLRALTGVAQLLCCLRRIGHILGGEDDQHPITLGILRHDFKRFRIAFWLGITEDIDGIVMTPGGR